MTMPRITVIIPSLNHGRYVERAICSVLDQDYDNLDFILIDGGSTDDTVEIIRIYEEDISHWCTRPDDGPADAINKALARATGDIIGILPADDIYLPTALDQVAKAMMGEDAPDWLIATCFRIDEDDEVHGSNQPALPSSFLAYLMHNSGDLTSQAAFFRKDLFNRYGPMDGRLQFAYDYEMSCRLLADGLSPRILPRTIAGRREHAGARAASNALGEMLEYIEVAEQFADHLPLKQRYELWRNCDQRRRIYALAHAEMCGRTAKRYLMHELVRHPWWLADHTIRHTLFHGVAHPLPESMVRPAA